jgi:hypothetical protein
MSNVIDFEKHKEKTPNLYDSNVKFEYKFLADYEARELYINVSFNDFDINVDVGINLAILSQLASINPMTKMSQKKIEEITGLEPQYVLAIYETYKKFGFIDSDTELIRSVNDIKKSYIEKRMSMGYPKNKKNFDQVLELEREVFNEFCDDISEFNSDLYWQANNKY